MESKVQSDTQSEYDLKSEEEDETVFQIEEQKQIIGEDKVNVDTDSQQINQDAKVAEQKIHKQFQHIFIAAYSTVYRQRLESLAFQLNCQLQFKKKYFTITCQNSANSQQWDHNKEFLIKQIQKIVYLKIQDKQKRFKLFNSPHINKVLSQKGIYICWLNNEVYLHSNLLDKKQLQEQKKQILRESNIYTVCFTKKKSTEPIDAFISAFYKEVCEEYYKQKFQKGNIIVQLSKNKKSVYVIGKPGAKPYQMMQGKTTVKSVIQGLSIIAFKNSSLDSKGEAKFRQYLKRISPFPILMGKLNENVMIILSKDNILRDLLKKTDRVISKAGIQQSTQIGIYLPSSSTRNEKRDEINKVCKQMQYDYWGICGIRYFRPMISTQQKNCTQTLQLLIRILKGFNQVKQKFEIIKTKKAEDPKIQMLKKKQLQQQNKYAYIQKNAIKDSVQLTKLLRRDVMQDEITMKKRYNVIYGVIEGKQLGPYYISRKKYDKGIDAVQISLIEAADLKKGQYFQTYLKVSDETQQRQELQKLLVEELKVLNEGAKDDKIESKSYSKDRRVAHMIKKLIIVL